MVLIYVVGIGFPRGRRKGGHFSTLLGVQRIRQTARDKRTRERWTEIDRSGQTGRLRQTDQWTDRHTHRHTSS